MDTFLINLWHLMIGIFSFPLVFIPFKEIYTDPKNIGNYLNNGFYCEFA